MSLTLVLGAAGCVDDATEPTESATPSELRAARGAPADDLVQPGAGLIPLAITADDHVFYQDGQTLYVTALDAHAQRTAIAEIPAGNLAFIYTSGLVAFIWTDPDQTSPSLGVSPLVVWTAKHGPRPASDASPVGTLTTVASRDGERVVFPTHARAGGVVGDIVEATADLRQVTPLVTGVQTDYTNGPCRPLSVFVEHGGDGGNAAPAIAYCAGADTSSTVSTFWGARRDLPGLVNPPQLQVDASGERLLTVRASADDPRRGSPVLVTAHAVTVLDEVHSSVALFGADGTPLYFNRTAPGQASARRARLRGGRITTDEIVPQMAAFHGNGFGSNALSHALTSRDGRWLAFATALDPATGLGDLNVVDVQARAPASTVVALDPALDNAGGTVEEPFTQDSAFVVSSKPDVTTGTQQFFATSICSHARRALGDAGGFNAFGAAGSFIAFNDHVQFNLTNFSLSTADVRVADAASGAARLIAAGANAQLFLDRRRTRVIYTTDEAGRAGLRAAQIR